MQSFQQMLADDRLGAETIELQLSPDTANAIAGLPVVVNCDYSGAGAEGIVLPVSFTVLKPDGSALLVREFSRVLPTSIDFTPVDPGVHLVRLAETNHNRSYGALEMSVTGDDKVLK